MEQRTWPPDDPEPTDLGYVDPRGLDRLLALTRATGELLDELGADVALPYGGTGARARTLREACRSVEGQAKLARFRRARSEGEGMGAAAAVSKRTADVLSRLLRGESEPQIAARLRMSRRETQLHVRVIYRLYRVNSLEELKTACDESPGDHS